MNAFTYVTADSFDAAARYLADASPNGILVKAGGIDVVDRLKERLAEPRVILNLRRVEPNSRAIRQEGDVVVIPALATVAAVGADPLVTKLFPALAQSASHAATPQVRNAATVGGNLCQKPRCWYFRSQHYPCLKKGGSTCFAVQGDNRYHAIVGAGACHIVQPSNLAVPLMAYDATIRAVRYEKGATKTRDVSIDEFYRVPLNPVDDEYVLEPGELIQEVRIPAAAGGPRSGYVEIRHKKSFDWPLVTCAVNLNTKGQPRIVMGAIAPIAWRLKRVEELIANGDRTDALIVEARRIATQGMQPMADNAYKVTLVGAALEDALRQAGGYSSEEGQS